MEENIQVKSALVGIRFTCDRKSKKSELNKAVVSFSFHVNSAGMVAS